MGAGQAARCAGGCDGRGSVAQRERELRALLDKAAKGLPVFDVDEIGAGYVEAARRVYGIVSDRGAIPDFISDAVQTVLGEAARVTGTELWIYPDSDDPGASGDYSVERMARMFKYHTFAPVAVEPKRALLDYHAKKEEGGAS